jgi:pyruvate/2-oxoglutarate dehydrogenase complex dihydrolipoamide acyltransferase (E2) component
LAFIYFLYNKDEVAMSGIRLIEVPKWGLSMEEGTVVKWLIPVGAAFAEGDEICDLETSKISNVVEAPGCCAVFWPMWA